MNIFLTHALPHGLALQALQQRKGRLYEGNYEERSLDGRLKTEKHNEQFKSSLFFFLNFPNFRPKSEIRLVWNGFINHILLLQSTAAWLQTGRSRQEQLILEGAVSLSHLQTEFQYPGIAETRI